MLSYVSLGCRRVTDNRLSNMPDQDRQKMGTIISLDNSLLCDTRRFGLCFAVEHLAVLRFRGRVAWTVGPVVVVRESVSDNLS